MSLLDQAVHGLQSVLPTLGFRYLLLSYVLSRMFMFDVFFFH